MLSLNVILAAREINSDVALTIIKLLPFIWIVAMNIEPVLIGRIAEKLVEKFTNPTVSSMPKLCSASYSLY